MKKYTANILTKFNDMEYWRDKSQWSAPNIKVGGKNYIFLLEALDRFGARFRPAQWSSLDNVYKDKSLYFGSAGAGDPEYSKSIHDLLRRWDPRYRKSPIEPTYFDEVNFPLQERYNISQYDVNLADSIKRFVPPILDDNIIVLNELLGELTHIFATETINTFCSEPLYHIVKPMSGVHWQGSKEITDKRFYFGEIDVTEKGVVLDGERGNHLIFVEEAQLMAFLEKDAKPELTLEEQLDEMILEFDALPKAECPTQVECFQKIRERFLAKGRLPKRFGEMLLESSARVRDRLSRFGQRGTKPKASDA